MTSKKHKAELVKLARNYRATSSDTDEAVFDFLSALDCPKSLAAFLLYKYKENEQLVDLDIDPLHYNNADEFRDAYAAWAFLSKSSFLPLDISKRDQAFKKFFKFEDLCKQTNSRFSDLSLDPLYTGANVWLLNAITRKIAGILGDFCGEEMFEHANWGPGVTTLLKGSHVSAVNKFHLENGITRGLYSLVGNLFPIAYPRWFEHRTAQAESCFEFVGGNGIVTVPKNSKTDRVIAVEPGINLWFQKGIGAMIRNRLYRWGVDLNSQVRNQQLAKEASKTGLLATVDFSSASDSVARRLVEEILPPSWFAVMNAARSPLGHHNKAPIHWEKFSSMGNGFTFELESLIFYAAALAVREYLGAEGEVSVFGDDVILPASCYELFSSFSEFLGFKVNLEKSFSSGNFRESCGAHYWNGVDCKPIFLKERLRNVQSFYKLANSVRLFAHRSCFDYSCDARFRGTWYHLLERVPKPLRFRCSIEIGDSGFISNFDEAVPSVARDGIEGYFTTVLIETGKRQYFDSTAMLLARLKAPSIQEYGNFYTLRGQTNTKIARVLVHQWYNLGPWLK